MLTLLLLLAGCGGNACEFWSTTGTPAYYCWQGEEADFCEAASGSVESAHFPTRTCADLGYTYHCSEAETGGGLEDKWTAGTACDESVPPAGRTPGSGGDGPCAVGTWDIAPDPACGGQFDTMTLEAGGTGIVYTPECTGQCAKEDSFVELTWSTSAEAAGTMTLTYGRTVSCGIDNPAEPLTVDVDFTCDTDTMVVAGVTWTRR